MASVEERLSAVEVEQRNHSTRDDDRFQTAVRDIGDIKEMIREFGRTLQNGFERVHTRIDEEAGKARHNLGNEVGKCQGLITQSKQESAAAVAVVAAEVKAVSEEVAELERGGRGYVERVLIFALGTALASIAYLIVYGPPWSKAAAQASGGN